MLFNLQRMQRRWRGKINNAFGEKIIDSPERIEVISTYLTGNRLLMLENLLDLIKENAGDTVINNPAIPNEHNEAVMVEAGHTITGGLQNMISQGNLEGLMNLFHGGGGIGANNSTVQNISTDFKQNLFNKFGLNQSAASGVAGSLIPSVLQSLVGKTNDPNDQSFNLQGILSQLSGGKGLEGLLGGLSGSSATGGIMDKIKGLFA
jgi:hypothetical protein